jgi:hypothetical protein
MNDAHAARPSIDSLERASSDVTPQAESAFARVLQIVHENRGEVTGIEAGVVYGDVVSHSIHVHVVSLPPNERTELLGSARTSGRTFLGALPFALEDRHVFFGRTARIAEVLRIVAQRPLSVVYGPTACGKTSLLAAGLTPVLAHRGAMTLRIDEFADVAGALYGAIAAQSDRLATQLQPSDSLPELAASLVQATKGTVVLILDQFERLFSLPDAQRERVIDELAACAQRADAERFRVVLSIRSDSESFSRLIGLQRRLLWPPEAMTSVEPLTRDEAFEAVVLPPRVQGRAAQFYEQDVHLLFDQLESRDLGNRMIEPAILQIVCNELYQRALAEEEQQRQAIINAAWFAEGVDTLAATWLRRELRKDPDPSEAVGLLLEACERWPEAWTPADHIAPLTGADDDSVLGRLVKLGALIELDSSTPRYTLPGQVIANAIERIGGTMAAERIRATRMLDGIWREWEIRSSPASKGQLGYLTDRLKDERSAPLTSPLQIVLLLRSAVIHGMETRTWVDCVERHRSSMTALEMSTGQLPIQSPVRSLLRVTTEQAFPKDYGVLAWAAAHVDRWVERRTAALCLSRVDGFEDRLVAALNTIPDARRRRARRRDALGALADAGIYVPRGQTELDLLEPLIVGGGRALRVVQLEARAIVTLTVGAALGMGLGLALLRATLALLSQATPERRIWETLVWSKFAVTIVVICVLMLALWRQGISPRNRGWQVVVAAIAGYGVGQSVVTWQSDTPAVRWLAPLLLALGIAMALQAGRVEQGAPYRFAWAFGNRCRSAVFRVWTPHVLPHGIRVVQNDEAHPVERTGHTAAIRAAGGAVTGLGLGLGAAGALEALFITGLWATDMSLAFLWAVILGLPMLLFMRVLLAIWPRASRWLVVAFGAIGFTCGHVWVMKANLLGILNRPWTTSLALGLGAALAVVAVHGGDVRLSRRWPLWLAATSICFAVVTSVLVALSDESVVDWASPYFPIMRTKQTYLSSSDGSSSDGYSALVPPSRRTDPRKLEFDYFEVIDASLVGLCLAGGLLAGLVVSHKLLTHWQELERLAGN